MENKIAKIKYPLRKLTYALEIHYSSSPGPILLNKNEFYTIIRIIITIMKTFISTIFG